MKWVGHLFAWLKSRPWTGITISVSCLALIVLRNIYPKFFAMDAVSVGLLVVAVAPWLRSAIKSIELAGVGKIELNDIEAVAKAVGASDLPGPGGCDAAPDNSESGQLGRGSPPEQEIEGDTSGKGPDLDSGKPMVNTHLPEESFISWLKRTNESGGWKFDERADSMSVFDIDSSHLSPRSWKQIQVDRSRDAMLSSLRLLCQIYGIAPLGLSAMSMLSRLQSSSAVTAKQAKGIAAAMDMLNTVLHTPTTDEAIQRALDVAKEVNDSLYFLVRRGEIVRLAQHRNSSRHGAEGDEAG
ncbi:hypothetical protein ACJ6WJ_04550 [Stenotrophomonas maltophilia]|uniref:hypothetical protein n=1 Tax=Stenotrophomonas maltophilia TaxID=40324 RepID=UPI003896DCC2